MILALQARQNYNKWHQKPGSRWAQPSLMLKSSRERMTLGYGGSRCEPFWSQQGLQDAPLGGKNMSSLSNKEKTEILQKAHNTIILSLRDKVLREIAKEETAAGIWLKLENLYMIKSLAN